jgi:hypothetical protein
LKERPVSDILAFVLGFSVALILVALGVISL